VKLYRGLKLPAILCRLILANLDKGYAVVAQLGTARALSGGKSEICEVFGLASKTARFLRDIPVQIRATALFLKHFYLEACFLRRKI